jgi:hypothetical protein
MTSLLVTGGDMGGCGGGASSSCLLCCSAGAAEVLLWLTTPRSSASVPQSTAQPFHLSFPAFHRLGARASAE